MCLLSLLLLGMELSGSLCSIDDNEILASHHVFFFSRICARVGCTANSCFVINKMSAWAHHNICATQSVPIWLLYKHEQGQHNLNMCSDRSPSQVWVYIGTHREKSMYHNLFVVSVAIPTLYLPVLMGKQNMYH